MWSNIHNLYKNPLKPVYGSHDACHPISQGSMFAKFMSRQEHVLIKCTSKPWGQPCKRWIKLKKSHDSHRSNIALDM